MRRRFWLTALAAVAAFATITFPVRANALPPPQPKPAACTYGSCAPSNLIVSDQATQQAATQTTGIIADRISQAINDIGGSSGSSGAFAAMPGLGSGSTAFALGGNKAAGSLPRNFGVWADAANLWLRDSQPGTDYSGQILTGIGGFDYLFNDRVLLGFAAGYERISLDTVFNNGNLNSNGFATALYGGYVLSPGYSIDFQAGHAWIRYQEAHGAVGAFDGDRWFGSANLNAKQALSAWRFAESFGFLYVNERQDQYVESNGNPVAATTVRLGQLRLKGLIGYYIPTAWGSLTPYGSARLEFDVSKSAAPVINSLGQTASNGDFGTTFALGVAARSGDWLTTTIEGTTTQFRQNFQSYGIRGSVRFAY